MKKVPLSQGLFALVDDEDYGTVSQYNWFVWKRRGSSYQYAIGHTMRAGTRTTLWMHRLIMQPPPNRVVDHINSNGLDNRRSNLRVCGRHENNFNSKSRRGSSRFKGVHWSATQNRWVAKATVAGRTHTFYFGTSEIEAARAYNNGVKRLHGKFACLNEV